MEDNTVMYLSPNAPTITVKLGGKRIKAERGVLRLTLGQAAELDRMMATRLDMRAAFKKVDLAQAEQQVKDHKAAQQKAAVAGPYASNNGPEGKLKEARQAQTSAALTGKPNPINTIETAASSKAPVEVNEMPVHQPGPGKNTNRFAKTQ